MTSCHEPEPDPLNPASTDQSLQTISEQSISDEAFVHSKFYSYLIGVTSKFFNSSSSTFRTGRKQGWNDEEQDRQEAAFVVSNSHFLARRGSGLSDQSMYPNRFSHVQKVNVREGKSFESVAFYRNDEVPYPPPVAVEQHRLTRTNRVAIWRTQRLWKFFRVQHHPR